MRGVRSSSKETYLIPSQALKNQSTTPAPRERHNNCISLTNETSPTS